MLRFFKSLNFALSGIWVLLKSERHFQIHTVVFIFVIFSGYFFKITRVEWFVILMVSTLVLVSEAFNSSLEKLSDALTMEKTPLIKQVKDIAAGAVLITVVLAIIIGVVVFFPYVSRLFH
jgi:diacylglycerol kinase